MAYNQFTIYIWPNKSSSVDLLQR